MIVGELFIFILFLALNIGSPLSLIIGLKRYNKYESYTETNGDWLIIFGTIGMVCLSVLWSVIGILVLGPYVEIWWNTKL